MACLSSSRKYLVEVLLIGWTPRVEGDGHVLPLNFWESKEKKKTILPLLVEIISDRPLSGRFSTASKLIELHKERTRKNTGRTKGRDHVVARKKETRGGGEACFTSSLCS